jgi:hypothetical protein
MKFLCILFVPIFVCLTFLYSTRILAANYSLSFTTNYVFTNDGTASVNKKLSLTNLTTASYPSEYTIALPNDAEQVVSFDEEGQTKTTIVDEDGQKKAKIVFNQESLGFGKDLTIALGYETKTLSSNSGGKWQVAIPGLSSGENVDGYTVSVVFPQEWGNPTRVIPPADEKYMWTLTERPETSISLSFEPKIPVTNTPTPEHSSNVIPIIAGISIGIVLLIFIFEVLKRL